MLTLCQEKHDEVGSRFCPLLRRNCEMKRAVTNWENLCSAFVAIVAVFWVEEKREFEASKQHMENINFFLSLLLPYSTTASAIDTQLYKH